MNKFSTYLKLKQPDTTNWTQVNPAFHSDKDFLFVAVQDFQEKEFQNAKIDCTYFNHIMIKKFYQHWMSPDNRLISLILCFMYDWGEFNRK